MRNSSDLSYITITRNPYSDQQIKRKSLYSPEKYHNPSTDRLSTESNDRPNRYFRLSNRSSLHDPITGIIKRYQLVRSISPLGSKNIKMPEKITCSSHEPNDYFFQRHTKRNPKGHNLNPITGEVLTHRTSKSFTPYDYSASSFRSYVNKPIRFTKGTGYQKSVIY